MVGHLRAALDTHAKNGYVSFEIVQVEVANFVGMRRGDVLDTCFLCMKLLVQGIHIVTKHLCTALSRHVSESGGETEC